MKSLTLENFTATDVADLYAQHTDDTGQPFTREAIGTAFSLTQGQPWLINALAKEAVEEIIDDESVTIELGHIYEAKERSIRRQDTHLDSFVERLREPRVESNY